MTLLMFGHAASVGVRAMDDQHGILMDMMNELRVALIRGCGRDQACEDLNRLIAFTQMHFASEERLLEQYAFPGSIDHRDAHRRLLGQIRETVFRVQHSEEVELRSLLAFLRGWFIEHLEHVDQHYGRWLNEQGVF